jgi:hypothetical protein
MSVQEFLENISLEDIEKLRKLKLEEMGEVPTYSFSKIKMRDLENLFEIKRVLKSDIFTNWFEAGVEISEESELFLENLLNREKEYISIYNEDDLKMRFLSPILINIDFRFDEFRDFYHEQITYRTDKFILNGKADFVFANGFERSEKPYFFIQEFKRAEEFSNPRPQLLAEMVAGLEISEVQTFRGAYIVGSIWNFVILEKIGEERYRYFVSENFDSSKIYDLKEIFRNLLFVKNEVLKDKK